MSVIMCVMVISDCVLNMLGGSAHTVHNMHIYCIASYVQCYICSLQLSALEHSLSINWKAAYIITSVVQFEGV